MVYTGPLYPRTTVRSELTEGDVTWLNAQMEACDLPARYARTPRDIGPGDPPTGFLLVHLRG